MVKGSIDVVTSKNHDGKEEKPKKGTKHKEKKSKGSLEVPKPKDRDENEEKPKKGTKHKEKKSKGSLEVPNLKDHDENEERPKKGTKHKEKKSKGSLEVPNANIHDENEEKHKTKPKDKKSKKLLESKVEPATPEPEPVDESNSVVNSPPLSVKDKWKHLFKKKQDGLLDSQGEVVEDPRIDEKRKEMKRAKCYEMYRARKMKRARQLRKKMRILKSFFTAENFIKWIANENKIKEEMQSLMSQVSEIPSEAPSDVSSVQVFAPPAAGVGNELNTEPGQELGTTNNHHAKAKRRISKKYDKKHRKSERKHKGDTFIVIKSPPSQTEDKKHKARASFKVNVKNELEITENTNSQIEVDKVSSEIKKVSFALSASLNAITGSPQANSVETDKKEHSLEDPQLKDDKPKHRKSSFQHGHLSEKVLSRVEHKTRHSLERDKKNKPSKVDHKARSVIKEKSKTKRRSTVLENGKSSSMEKRNSIFKKFSLRPDKPEEKKFSLKTDSQTQDNDLPEENYAHNEEAAGEDAFEQEMEDVNLPTQERKITKHHHNKNVHHKVKSRKKDSLGEKNENQIIDEAKLQDPNRNLNYQDKIHVQIRYMKWKFFDELPHNYRLGQLKTRIFMFSRIEPYKQKLYYKGKKLKDDRKTIAEYVNASYMYNGDNPIHFHLKYRNDCAIQEEIEAKTATVLLPPESKKESIDASVPVGTTPAGKSESGKMKDIVKLAKAKGSKAMKTAKMLNSAVHNIKNDGNFKKSNTSLNKPA